jgi:hypothetical protein
MSTARWNDKHCALCGNLAQYRTVMYLEHRGAPGLEFLCKACKGPTRLPAKTILIPTNCAEPDCPLSADAWFELADKETERHYLCGEHAWYWHECLGPEREMFGQNLSLTGDEEGPIRRFLPDGQSGVVWGDASDR